MTTQSGKMAHRAVGLVFSAFFAVGLMKPGVAGVPTIDEFSTLAKAFEKADADKSVDGKTSDDVASPVSRGWTMSVPFAPVQQGTISQAMSDGRLDLVLQQAFHIRMAALEEMEKKLRAAQELEADSTVSEAHVALEDMMKLKEQALAAAFEAVQDMEVIIDSDKLLERVMAAVDMRNYLLDIRGNLTDTSTGSPASKNDSSASCEKERG